MANNISRPLKCHVAKKKVPSREREGGGDIDILKRRGESVDPVIYL